MVKVLIEDNILKCASQVCNEISCPLFTKCEEISDFSLYLKNYKLLEENKNLREENEKLRRQARKCNCWYGLP